MQNQNESAQADQKPKRMLELTRLESGKTRLAINFSSLDLLQTCLRKSYYSLVRGLRNEGSPAPAFGKAVHKGLEVWYSLPASERSLASTAQKERAELMAFGHSLEEPADYGALEAIRQAVLVSYDVLKDLPSEDKRSLQNLVRILVAYFKHYVSDGLEIVRDDQGHPFVERDFEFTLFENEQLEVRFFGTIDMILRDVRSGLVMLADHKTTSKLGSSFYDRCKPNHQYTGYVLGAQRSLGLTTNLFMVNGIFVGKTQQFARQVTSRDTEDFRELEATALYFANHWHNAIEKFESGLSFEDCFPQSAPNACTMWGRCDYYDICSVPAKLRENIIRAKWPDCAESKKGTETAKYPVPQGLTPA